MTALDGENPLPASLVVRVLDAQEVESTAQRIMDDPAFAEICDDSSNPAGDVQYGQGTVERLLSLASYIRIAAVALVILLTFVAFVFINNTIRLAITARRREIGIMRLVGASNGFIRGPFIMEGTVEAIIGALLAIAALAVGANTLLPELQQNLSFLAFEIPATTLYICFAGLLVIGVIIGLFGSAIAMRRYLKV